MNMTTNIINIEAPELQGVEKSRAEQIIKTFAPMVTTLKEFEGKYVEILKEAKEEITLEITAKAKRLRLDISKVRIDTDKIRKAEKEKYLRAGKAIDGVSNILKWAVVEKENELENIEKHFEVQEQKRLETLQLERVGLLAQYVDDASERDLSSMDKDVWDAYLSTKKQAYIDRVNAEKEAYEAKRLAEIEEQKERERIRLENIRLKEEAEKREKAIEKERQLNAKKEAAERAKAEALLAKEREATAKREAQEKEARDQLEAKLQAQKEETEKIQAEARLEAKRLASEREEQERKEEASRLMAAQAPDKEKLYMLEKLIRDIEVPSMTSEKGLEIINGVLFDLDDISNRLKNEASKL